MHASLGIVSLETWLHFGQVSSDVVIMGKRRAGVWVVGGD
jgi:hypothetical protein